MKISKLALYNFGIYAGNNVFDFNCDKPVILIGGMNGRGKTTIIEAILFALYGRRSFAFEESGLTFPDYLKQRVNTFDNSNTARVELEFHLSLENGNQTYLVKREWRSSAQTPSVKTSVFKNQMYDQFLSDNWSYFVEEMLPSAIAPFFFFDGEKISYLANSDDDTYIKQSIKALLGINVIETAIDDVQRIIKRHQKSVKLDVNSKELKEYERKLSEADKKLKIAKEEVGHLDAMRLQIEDKLKKAENKFYSMGGSLVTSRAELLDKQVNLNDKLEKVNEFLLEVVSGNLPLLIIMPLLKKILNDANYEREQRSVQAALEQLPTLFRSYEKNAHIQLDVDDFMDYVKNNVSISVPIYNLTDEGHIRLQALCNTFTDQTRQDIAAVLLERDRILLEKTEIENYLSINVNEDDVGKLYRDILHFTAELATIKEQLRSARILEAAYNSQFEELSRQQVRIIEKAVGSMESADDMKRILMYAGYSSDVLKEFGVRLQSQKTAHLASTMTNCFKKLVSKHNLLKEIKIDEGKLQFHYFNNRGEEINHSSFSAGEKQLLVISMLWALGICSKKQFPVVIDTPLARLDSVHREALITNYFPEASEQIILLSTDQEIYGNLYQLLSPHIGKEYTLLYDVNTERSSIEEGYFGGR